ncbi:hypothetical protein MUN82_10060 [Hymenobacter aerilatus]|uniref:Uncharacterized protein n=1 Tax=Hymenobacter aerilatus TaxID=2932251 RepID=A0A8T9T371_9BACT|nr:hypothetical protein [Hymenobacter aerilatus]UOR07423.1 hypothetical protein MUN82_10060 [Hymenobacter aerilatus]
MESTTNSSDNQLEHVLTQLQSCDQRIKDVAKYMVAEAVLFPMDLLTSAVLNRSLAMLNGFILLMRGNNSLTALHLVRLQLDSLLRYSAAWLVSEPHSFANEVLAGKSIKTLKDRTGSCMQDWYLVNELAKEYDWVKPVYQATSGYIHLSEKHYHSSTRRKEGADDTIETVISSDDPFIPQYLKIEATEAMIEITNQICNYAFGWADTKHGNGPVGEQ